MGYRVSILVPVYGAEQYIERCVRSLFEQTCQALEYVFVNDCSPDKSMELLSRVLEDYPERKGAVRIVNHEKNRGLAAARNTGVENATGEFVCLVDSDDWLERNAVEVLLAGQQEKDADIVSGSRMVHLPNKESVLQEPKYQSSQEMTSQMMQRNWNHFITGRLFRRSLIVGNTLRWNEGLDVAEDRFMMTLLSYYAKRFDRVDAIVYHYEHRNPHSLTIVHERQKVFDKNEQETGNVLALKQFFKDKELSYFSECRRCYMEQLELNLNVSLAYASKREFNRIVGVIDSCPKEDFHLIGWVKTGVKGWYLHNYGCMRMALLRKKAVRFAKKRFCKNSLIIDG